MDIEAALRQHLLGDDEIAGMIGECIYPLRLPQESGCETAIVYQRISSVRVTTQDDDSAPHLATTRIQLTLIATSYTDAHALANAVVRRCHGFRGVMGDRWIGRADVEGMIDDYAPATERHIVRADVLLWHREGET